jgi:hypothetical protein
MANVALVGVIVAFALTAPAKAVTYLGDLTDGALDLSTVTGYWSLSVDSGDSITVTARRLVPIDIWAAGNLPSSPPPGGYFIWGDDQLPPLVGGVYGDPQFSFVAAETGVYSIGVFRCCVLS